MNLVQMILCIIAGGLTWKLQSNGTKIVAQELSKICESVIERVNEYAIKGKTNLFSTNTTGNEHFVYSVKQL